MFGVFSRAATARPSLLVRSWHKDMSRPKSPPDTRYLHVWKKTRTKYEVRLATNHHGGTKTYVSAPITCDNMQKYEGCATRVRRSSSMPRQCVARSSLQLGVLPTIETNLQTTMPCILLYLCLSLPRFLSHALSHSLSVTLSTVCSPLPLAEAIGRLAIFPSASYLPPPSARYPVTIPQTHPHQKPPCLEAAGATPYHCAAAHPR